MRWCISSLHVCITVTILYPAVIVELHLGRQTQFQCVNMWEGLFPHILTSGNSWTPAGCWRTQLSSRAICAETVPDSQVKGSMLQDCRPPPTGRGLQDPGRYLCFWPNSYRLEGPMTSPLGSINLLEWLTELRKTLTFTSLIKDTMKDKLTARWRGTGSKVPSKGPSLLVKLRSFWEGLTA